MIRLSRRLWSVIPLLVSLALLLVSCGSRQAHDDSVEYLIGISQANLTEPWRITMSEEIRETARTYPNVRIIFTDAADSNEKQIRDVHKLLDLGIDLLIISPNEAVALTPVVTEAYARIPVILLDRAVEGYEYTLFIGPDNRLIGSQAGKEVVEMLGDRGGKVVEILGRSGSPPVTDRSLGFHEAIARAGNIHIVDTISGDWLRDRAEDNFASRMPAYRDVNVVFAQNDPMAYGAYRAAERLDAHAIRFVGIDGLPGPSGGIDLVRRGILDATFICPTGGKEAVRYAIDILHHADGIPKKIFLRTQKVTRSLIESGSLQSPAPRTVAAGNRRIVLGFAQVGKESEWRIANTASIQSAAQKAGIDLIFVDGQQRQENQITAIRSFIKQRVDVIAFSPIVESGWEDVLQEAKAAGIPVILSDRAVDVKDDSLWVTFMGSDFVEEGRRAARWLIDKMYGHGAVNIVELQGTVGSAPAIDRKHGFEEVIKDHPQFRIIESQSADFTKELGEKVMREFLKKDGSRINVLFAHNDDMAIGAIRAIEDYGLKPGTDIIIVSVDAARGAFNAMIAGKLNCTVECNPLLGDQLMKAVKDYMEGKDLPTRIITSESVFPAEVASKVLPGRKY